MADTLRAAGKVSVDTFADVNLASDAARAGHAQADDRAAQGTLRG